VWCVHVAVIVVCQNCVNDKRRRACYMQAVWVHLVRPSVLAQIVRQFFSSSTSESFLEVRGKSRLSVAGSSRRPSVKIAINTLSVMWPNNIDRCADFFV
jgi:hypothetical protein